MKYTCSIDIDLPLEKTVKLWEDENNFKHWQDGFKSIKHLNGSTNTVGATSKIILNSNQKIELLETILVSNLPHEKTALYEHKHMANTQTTRFIAIDTYKTQYISEVEYTKFNGLFIKVIAKLFPKKFKAQSEKWMLQFKTFAENCN